MSELKGEIEKAKKENVPVDHDYDVIIKSMSLTESQKGQPMVIVEFEVIDGEYNGGIITMKQVVTQGFQIHIMNEFLRSIQYDIEVDFEEYQQYGTLIEDIFKSVRNRFEYSLKYGKTASGYKSFRINKVYELE